MIKKYTDGLKARIKTYKERVGKNMDEMLQSDIVGVFASIAFVGLFSMVVLVVSVVAAIKSFWK